MWVKMIPAQDLLRFSSRICYHIIIIIMNISHSNIINHVDLNFVNFFSSRT